MTGAYLNKRVIVTGGLGFIGSNLARKLVELGARVTLCDSLIPVYGGNLYNVHDIRDRVTININDVRDRFAIEHLLQEQDFLFNLAGQTSHIDSMTDPRADLDINAAAQLSILEACRSVNSDIRIVFASTRQIYGKPSYLPVDEEHPICPVDVNGINKLAGEWYHLLYSRVHGIRSTVLRLTNTYGPGMRVRDARQTFLGIWIRQLIEGQTIKIFGDGLQVRDFNYVDDCVEAMLLAGIQENAVGKIYNLGSEEIINLRDLAARMLEIVPGRSCEIVPFPPDRQAIDIGDYYSNFSLIRNELGWSPRILLDEGLRKTINYYSAFGRHYWG